MLTRLPSLVSRAVLLVVGLALGTATASAQEPLVIQEQGSWLTATKSANVKAIVDFEPGSSFLFPQGEMPAAIPSAFDTVEGADAQYASAVDKPQ